MSQPTINNSNNDRCAICGAPQVEIESVHLFDKPLCVTCIQPYYERLQVVAQTARAWAGSREQPL